jgi:hypothetical protein
MRRRLTSQGAPGRVTDLRHCVANGGVLTLSEIRSFNTVNLGLAWVTASSLRAMTNSHSEAPAL